MLFQDMPVQMDQCETYQSFLDQVSRGRAVAIIPVRDPEGVQRCYVYSGKLDRELTKRDAALWNCVRWAHRARDAAEAEGLEPLP